MERSFRCPQCRNVVTVPLHVFPVCPECGYSRRGDNPNTPAQAEWGMAPDQEHVEFEADPGQEGLDDVDPSTASDASAPSAQEAEDSSAWAEPSPVASGKRSRTTFVVLLVLGIVVLVAGLALAGLGVAAVAGIPKNAVLYGAGAAVVGVALAVSGILARPRPGPAA